jgi:hypothetical protein
MLIAPGVRNRNIHPKVMNVNCHGLRRREPFGDELTPNPSELEDWMYLRSQD